MSEWQPIETAPKDGSIILVWGGLPGGCGTDELEYYEGEDIPRWPKRRPVSAWYDDEWCFCSYDSGFYGAYDKPTHWMPLPEHP